VDREEGLAVLDRNVLCGRDARLVHRTRMLPAAVDAQRRGAHHHGDLVLVAEPGFLAVYRHGISSLNRAALHEVWTSGPGSRLRERQGCQDGQRYLAHMCHNLFHDLLLCSVYSISVASSLRLWTRRVG